MTHITRPIELETKILQVRNRSIIKKKFLPFTQIIVVWCSQKHSFHGSLPCFIFIGIRSSVLIYLASNLHLFQGSNLITAKNKDGWNYFGDLKSIKIQLKQFNLIHCKTNLFDNFFVKYMLLSYEKIIIIYK